MFTEGAPAFIDDLVKLGTNNAGSPQTFCKGLADAIKKFIVSGMPMTQHKGPPPDGLKGGQAVSGNMTAAPGAVTATGLGAIDSASPGGGYGVKGKAKLVADLTKVFNKNDQKPPEWAKGVAEAIRDAMLTVKVMTKVTGTIPPGVAVPGPAGPVGPGSYIGTGVGGLDKDAPGPGLDTALPQLVQKLLPTFTDNASDPAKVAKGIADSLEWFISQAKVDTVDNGAAGGGPAAVSTESSSGSTGPAGSPVTVGQSSKGTIS